MDFFVSEQIKLNSQRFHLIPLLVSIGLGLITAVSYAADFLGLFGRPWKVQILLIFLLLLLFGAILYLFLSSMDYPLKKRWYVLRLLGVLFFLVLGVFLVNQPGFMQLPYRTLKMDLQTINAKVLDSSDSEIQVIRILADDQKVPLSALKKQGIWKKISNRLISKPNERASLSYFFDPNTKKVQIIFGTGPTAGQVQIKLDGQIQTRDLYQMSNNETTLTFILQSPFENVLWVSDILVIGLLFYLLFPLPKLLFFTFLTKTKDASLRWPGSESVLYRMKNLGTWRQVSIGIATAVIIVLITVDFFIVNITGIWVQFFEKANPANNAQLVSIGFIIAYSLALLITVNQAWMKIFQPKHWVKKGTELLFFLSQPPFYLCAIIISLVFLITRLPFFLDYPIVGLAPDTGSYAALVQMVKNGQYPLFSWRSPGYPLFIWLVTTFVDQWIAVIAVQNLMMFASVLLIIYGVYRLRRSLALLSTLALAGFLGSSQILMYDTYALTESLYTSCIIFSFAFLLMGFGLAKAKYFTLSSIMMAGIILVKPAGMYFLVIYFVILLYLLWNKYTKRTIVGFLIPLPVILLLLCTYNYFTIKVFTVTTFGEANLAGATIWLWEPDENFSPQVNSALQALPMIFDEAGFTEMDRQIIRTSWDSDKLYPLFIEAYKCARYSGLGSGGGGFGNYMTSRDIIRMVALTAIRKHVDLYAKFVWTNIVRFFKNIKVRLDFYSILYQRAEVYYLGKDQTYDLSIAKEYIDPSPPKTVSVEYQATGNIIILKSTPLKSFHIVFQLLQQYLFQRVIWAWLFLVLSILSTCTLVYTKGRHLGAFLLFLFAITVLGACLLVSLVEIGLERYAYPTQFIYYLSVALSPLLWFREVSKDDANNQAY